MQEILQACSPHASQKAFTTWATMFFFCSREDDEVKGLEERQERSGLHPLCLAVDDEGDH